jgi:hypothetical protein
MNSIVPLRSEKVHLHPCSVEKFPSVDGVYAAGMYELDEASKTRAGCVTLYKKQGHLSLSHTVDAGILDMKFNGNFLGCALSTSQLCVLKYACDAANVAFVIEHVSTTVPDEDADDGLFLSLDWSAQERGLCDDSCFVATSTQNGAVKLYSCSETDGALRFNAYKSLYDIHKLYGEVQPVWIVAFDPHSRTDNSSCPNSLLTGGDDSTFKLWDVRMMEDGHERTDAGASCRPTATGKYHQAGVTTATFHPTNQNVFLTGSYDQNLCVWDKRNLRSPVTAVETAGGVWRAKWGAVGVGGKDYVFLSCMQGGSMVYELDCSGVVPAAPDTVFQGAVATDPSLLQHIATHRPVKETATDENGNSPELQADSDAGPSIATGQEHLAYGIDVIGYEPDTTKGRVGSFAVASCSFYDNQLFEWEVSL